MKLARVAGTVVSTINEPTFDEQRLLVCDYLSPDGEPSGGYVIAVDVVGAGPSDVLDDVPSQAATARAISSSTHVRFETVMV